MKAITLLVLCLIATASASQSNLPPCDTRSNVLWTNCIGSVTFPSGNKYVGEFKDGITHGQGTFTWANGNKYVGEFRDDHRTGQGTFTWANGDRYVGEFKEGNKHGQGTYTGANGDKYAGEWRGDMPHGGGVWTFADGKPPLEGIWEQSKFIKAERIPDQIAGRSSHTSVAQPNLQSNKYKEPSNNENLSTLITDPLSFQHLNKVWTLSGNTNCTSDYYMMSWTIGNDGSLVQVGIYKDGPKIHKVNEYIQSPEKFTIKYSDNTIEVYEYKQETVPGYSYVFGRIRLIELIIDGDVVVRNGLNLRRNQFTRTYSDCGRNSAAIKLISNALLMPNKITWRWPPNLGHKFSYCSGVLRYASNSSDNIVGRSTANELSRKSIAKARSLGVPSSTFADFAMMGESDAAEIYKTTFNIDLKSGKINPTISAKNQIRYAVRECQNTFN